MQIYATQFPVTKNFTRENMIQMVIDWNQGSKYRITDIPWDGQAGDFSAGDENCSLTFVELADEGVIAGRYRYKDRNGILWTTDHILNRKTNIFTLRRHKEVTDQTTSITKNLRPPQLLKTMFRKGYVSKDGQIITCQRPVSVTSQNVGLVADVIMHRINHLLPVVYISRSSDGRTIVDPLELAYRLQGIAHVLCESQKAVSYELRDLCGGANAHHGDVAVYFPNPLMQEKVFFCNHEGQRLEEILVETIYQYMNQKCLGSLSTWEEIQADKQLQITGDLFIQHQNAETEKQEVYDVFNEQLKESDLAMAEIRKKMESLIAENNGLRAKLEAQKSSNSPLLFYGKEKEFFPGEIKDVILDVLKEYQKGKEGTRRGDLIHDLLEANGFSNRQQDRKEAVKRVFKGMKGFNPYVKGKLKEQGLMVTGCENHYKIAYYGDPRYYVTSSATPGDTRTNINLVSEICNIML